uniref:Uncharacterized protein n=1 Tax=Plectus sambesii TaxID=2011161 RepID=A0A914V1L1_9BILA
MEGVSRLSVVDYGAAGGGGRKGLFLRVVIGAQLQWVDEKGKKMKYSAPQYVNCVLTFCEKGSCSEELFPTKY